MPNRPHRPMLRRDAARRRVAVSVVALGLTIGAAWRAPAPAAAAPPPPGAAPRTVTAADLTAAAAAHRPASGDAADQAGAWEAVAVPGATCGRGAPFKYYLNASDTPGAGIFFLLNGGGACMKEGQAPTDATGIARELYCMDYSNFTDPLMNDTLFAGPAGALIPVAIPYFNRSDAANPFRDHHFVAVPYCTGDVHTGRVGAPFDYDPDPAATFDVTHRGHLNLMGVVDDVYRRYPEDRPVVLSGMSAGAFGAIFNFPEVVERWPRTALVADSGVAPPHGDSLMRREGSRVAARWGARDLLPDYCPTDDCLADMLRLLGAHADHYDGTAAPWRPFGFLQSQRDATLAAYLELSPCGFAMGLRRGLAGARPPNLRAYAPASDKHVFSVVLDPGNPLAGPRPFVSAGGVSFLAWFRSVATATTVEALPADAVDPWQACNAAFLPYGFGGR